MDHQRLFDGSSLRVLHWAPELGWANRLRRLPGVSYLSGDVDPTKAIRELDLTCIDLPDESIDLTLCSHVLEHVPDDRTAMSELLRILRPGGHTLVMVPLTRAPTDEDPTITDPEERRRRFGQTDHVRRYNAHDVGARLADAGFLVERFRAADLLPTAERRRLGIDGPDVVWWAKRPEN